MTEIANRADAHCHLDALSPEELETGLRDARAAGIGLMVTVGMDVETSARAVEIAEATDGVYAAVGLHPWLAQDHPGGPPVDELRELARSPKVVAIGEIGLDFVGNTWRNLSYDDPELQRIQEAAFRRQLRLAQELELPVILHCRNAHEPITRVMAEEGQGRLGGCVQFQDGGAGDVPRYTALNFTFSIGSSVTFPDPDGRWADAVRAVPDDALLLETDAPWLPYEGSGRSRSVPADLTVVGETVARVRGTDPERVYALTSANLRRALPRIA
jgi:TatD DNase family protein